MKTLDEVIDALERCYTPHIFDCKGCPYEDDDSEVECNSYDRDTDVLNYLKTYRADKLEWEQTRETNEERYQEAVRNCERAENKFIARLKELNVGTLNEPLTWDELRTMEGKPVWVEYNFHIGNKEIRDKSKQWCIIREFKPWHDTEIIITSNGFVLSKNEHIKCWQAYRKERQASGGSLAPDPRTVRIGEGTKITWHCPDKKE